jgi:two-component system phosphate regulon response regulator PhoB
MSLASILLVDSDPELRASMARRLRELGHDVSESETAVSALKQIRRKRPDLMICDFALPDLSGVDLLNDVRSSEQFGSIRVLITSARKGSDDVVQAFESGADDFIDKPVDMLELRARVGACLRRPASPGGADRMTAGGITIDNVGRRVSVDGDYVSLAPREYRLLQFLVFNRDRVFSRKQLLVHVWEQDSSVGPRTVDVHVRRLRSVLEPFGYERYLQTVRGSGYRFSLDA